MSCVTTPSRPTSASVRDGTPGASIAPDQARPQHHERRAEHDDERRQLHGRSRSPVRRQRPAAAAPRLTKITPKCGIDTSMIAATMRNENPGENRSVEAEHRAGLYAAPLAATFTIATIPGRAGRPAVIPGHGVRASISSSAMTKHTSSRAPSGRRCTSPSARARGPRAPRRRPPTWRDVLDGPEARDRVAHRGAEVAEDRGRRRADERDRAGCPNSNWRSSAIMKKRPQRSAAFPPRLRLGCLNKAATRDESRR